jgi:hypothetical protein
VNSVNGLWKQALWKAPPTVAWTPPLETQKPLQVAGDSSYSTWDELYAALKTPAPAISQYSRGPLNDWHSHSWQYRSAFWVWTLVVETPTSSSVAKSATHHQQHRRLQEPSSVASLFKTETSIYEQLRTTWGLHTNQNFEGDTDGSTRSQLTATHHRHSLCGNINPCSTLPLRGSTQKVEDSSSVTFSTHL